MMYKGKATCLNMNDNENNWIEWILCSGDIDCQTKFGKMHQLGDQVLSSEKSLINLTTFQQDI